MEDKRGSDGFCCSKDNGKLLILFAVFAMFAIAAFQLFATPKVQDTTITPTTIYPGDAIQILEYSDFKCPYCSRAAATVEQLRAEYGEKINVEFKHFPLAFHAGSDIAAQAAECARDQGQFWTYHDLLFNNSAAGVDVGKPDTLKKLASQIGLDSGAFNQCLDTQSKKEVVESQIEEGKSLGVTGTPTFFIAGQKLVGAQPLGVFKNVIKSKMEAAI